MFALLNVKIFIIFFLNNFIYYSEIYYLLVLDNIFFLNMSFLNKSLYLDNIIHPLLLLIIYLYIINFLLIFRKKSNLTYKFKYIFNSFIFIIAIIGGLLWFFKIKQNYWLWDPVEVLLILMIFFFLLFYHFLFKNLLTKKLFLPLIFYFYFFVQNSIHKFTQLEQIYKYRSFFSNPTINSFFNLYYNYIWTDFYSFYFPYIIIYFLFIGIIIIINKIFVLNFKNNYFIYNYLCTSNTTPINRVISTQTQIAFRKHSKIFFLI